MPPSSFVRSKSPALVAPSSPPLASPRRKEASPKPSAKKVAATTPTTAYAKTAKAVEQEAVFAATVSQNSNGRDGGTSEEASSSGLQRPLYRAVAEQRFSILAVVIGIVLIVGSATVWPASGDVYEGEWKAGKKEGRGTIWHANGGVYEGEFKAGNMEGHGTFRYATGDVYEGEWKAGKKEGRGKYRFANGAEYVGTWKAGEKEGHGTFRSANGDVYEGKWKANKRGVRLQTAVAAARQTVARQLAAKQAAARQDSERKQEAARMEEARMEAARLEAARQEAERKQEAERMEAVRMEAARASCGGMPAALSISITLCEAQAVSGAISHALSDAKFSRAKLSRMLTY